MKTIYLGSDHAGFELKEVLKDFLTEKGEYDVQDLGTANEEESVDYPEYGKKVGEAVVQKEGSYGILVCGTGIGISIAANKVQGVIAAPINNVKMAKLFRQHNGGNILSLGGRDMEYIDLPEDIVEAFLTTEIDHDPRHKRRRNMFECQC